VNTLEVMPWENRFDVKTASQTNAYRQLIGKEAMRRRNEAAILSQYRFHDQVTSLDGLGVHWDGTVVAGGASAVRELDPKFESYSQSRQLKSAASGEGHASRRRDVLNKNLSSTVLHEGYAYNKATLASTASASFNPAASVVADDNRRLNPDSAEPRTLARVREENRQLMEQRALLSRQRARDAAEERARGTELLARLQLDAPRPNAPPSQIATISAAAAAARQRSYEPSDSGALGDVLPAHAGASETPAASPKRHGLRSCFLPSSRPISGKQCDAIAARAREVFAPLPTPPQVLASRQRLAEISRQREATSVHRSLASPRSPSRHHPLPHSAAGEAKPHVNPPTPPRSPTKDDATEAQRFDRLQELEFELDGARADRRQMQGELLALCTVLEKQQPQSKQLKGAGKTAPTVGRLRPASSRPSLASTSNGQYGRGVLAATRSAVASANVQSKIRPVTAAVRGSLPASQAA
jgi:hypothetical protein